MDQRATTEGHPDGSVAKPFHDIQTGVDMCGVKRSQLHLNVVCRVWVGGGVYTIHKPISVQESNIHILGQRGEVDPAVVTSDVEVAPVWRLHDKRMDRFKGKIMRRRIYEKFYFCLHIPDYFQWCFSIF